MAAVLPKNGGAVYLQSGSPAFTMEAGTIQSGTAFIHGCAALSNEVMYNDYIHASDLGRVISSYTWYCKLAGIEELTELKFTTIPKKFFRSRTDAVDYQLTEMEQKIIIESVNNALKEPLQQTQSQYTTAPEA